MLASRFKSLFLASTLALSAAPAIAEPIYGITSSNLSVPSAVSSGTASAATIGPQAVVTELVLFDSTTPSLLTTIGAITGLVGSQTLRGIDFRPSDGRLYAVSTAGTAGQLYTVNLLTGALTSVGSGFVLDGNTSDIVTIDFNPVANALRVVTGSDQSYRINANTGALAAMDTSISPSSATISGVAYSNNVAGATSTTLYAYEYIGDTVGTIGGIGGVPSPNLGVYTVVGSSGVFTGTTDIGFDISGATSIAYLSITNTSTFDFNSEFYRVNLATGAASLVGQSPVALLDISVRPTVVPEPETLGLLAIGLLSFGAAARRRRQA